jgi:aminoglycoside phosphotransferase (APT) family kinase protein
MATIAAVRGADLTGAPGDPAQGRFLLKADLAEADASLRALRAPDPADEPPGSAEVARAVADVTGLRVASVGDQVHRGTFRWVVPIELANGQRAMVRINRLDHPELDEGLRVEASVLGHLRRRGLAVPGVLAIDASRAVIPTFAVIERFEGPTLADRDGDEAAAARGLRSLGGFLRQVHRIALPGAGPVAREPGAAGREDTLTGRLQDWSDYLALRLDDHLRTLAAAGLVTAAESDRIGAAIARARLPGGADRLLHGDPGGPNVILDPTGLVRGLVDWEDALVGDPWFELASCAAFHPERRWVHLFEGYGVRLAAERAERFWLYYLRIVVARSVVRLRFHIADLPGRPPAAARIHRALDGLERPEEVRA